MSIAALSLMAFLSLGSGAELQSNGAKLQSFRENGVERAYMDKDGKCFERSKDGGVAQVDCKVLKRKYEPKSLNLTLAAWKDTR